MHDLYLCFEIFLDSQVSIFVPVIKYFPSGHSQIISMNTRRENSCLNIDKYCMMDRRHHMALLSIENYLKID